MSYEAQDFINRFLIHDPNQRLGANGSAEVKSHSFLKGVNWDNLALQKAVFVPQPDSIDDTSYFVSRFSHISSGVPDDEHCSNSGADSCDLCSDSGDEMDECGDLTEFASSIDLSLMNFSFKNLSQLASINHEVLLQNGKDSTKGSSSPSKGLGT
ncbi:probable serine/threonine protein kinase IRE [Carica papaya]|uniref:probable serine/threonine protein kinase IRE n=1 Tax=Carica papaya TaxID=3649 RepID=UPI000B8CF575|nr:probable serine/threonine protein kinase IRE [Carica papaya]XP_021896431.1 probable serine/threonine protein kinase IRE [Carica papaya]XP_021896432.1 probable serine/threonine protein kinase IRE [Carica papaya]XP_021896433.1 probable serine/threonine protein kinase IRE [Carica papaya]